MKEALQYLAESRWTYIAYWLPLIIFVIIFYIKNKTALAEGFKSFIAWAKQSLETAHQASPEKITAFVIVNFVYVPCRIIFTYKVFMMVSLEVWHIIVGGLLGSIIDAVFVLLIYGIVKPQQIIELKNGLNIKEVVTKTEEVK